MTQIDIDVVLASEDQITPSPTFLKSVMEAVEREASTPPPLVFPWLRASPGFLAAFIAMLVAIWNGIDSMRDPVTSAAFEEQLRQFTSLATGVGLQWVAIAAAITLASLVFSSSLLRPRHGAFA